jgi:hypothetical protein
MTRNEQVELALIPVTGASFWLLAALLPEHLSLGQLLLQLSALLLLQGLIRDIFLLLKSRSAPPSAPSPAQRCICLESTVGITGILLAASLLTWGSTQQVGMQPWQWSLAVMLLLSGGLAIKDYVLETNPWRIRRDKDHLNIIFTWKNEAGR